MRRIGWFVDYSHLARMGRIGRKVKSKYSLDWIFVESYLRDDPELAEACRIAPHFARTMNEANEAFDDPDSALAADQRRRSRRTCRSLPRSTALAQILAASPMPKRCSTVGTGSCKTRVSKGMHSPTPTSRLAFAPACKYLRNFPQVVNDMCQQIDWTYEPGQNFQADRRA